jgi:hypothetical protein
MMTTDGFGVSLLTDAARRPLLRNYSGYFLSQSMYSPTARSMSYCGR